VRSSARRTRVGPKRQIRKESETRAREQASRRWAAPIDADRTQLDEWVAAEN
jgi:hypothetical protein